MDLDKLKKKRKTVRGVVTKLLNKIADAQKAETTELDTRLLRQWSVNLEENSENLKQLDSDILGNMIENDVGESDCEQEAEDANEIRERITYNKICLQDLMGEFEKLRMVRSDSKESIGSNSAVSNASETPHRRAKAKLPQLELKKFSGKVAEWQEFWDAFESAIHDEEDLANVDKFKYLRSFLEEPARSVITGIPLTDKDYETAVEILKKRYAKPGVIQRAHINEMINLQAVFSEKNSSRLRNLHDQIEIHYRGLEAIGVDKNSYSSIVVPVLMEKVPEAIRYNMIRFGGKNHLDWTLDEFIFALGKELEVRESHVPIFGQQNHQSDRPKPQRNNNVGTATALFAKEEGKCTFCQKTHNPEDCDEVKDHKDRKNILVKSGKCFVCLRGGHRSFQCRNKARCKICKGKHHTAICSSAIEGSSTPPITNSKETQPKPTSASTLNVHATTWVGNTASSGVKVALQTAIANVKGERMRILFDTGSQKTFISKKAAGKLCSSPARTEELGIKAFGQDQAQVSLRNVYKLSVEPLFDGKCINIEAFEVDEISKIANIHVEEIKKRFAHLNDIFFSDASKKQENLEIDILCGSDFLWHFQEGEAIRGGPGEPVAVRTTLGWVLSGPIKGEASLFNESVDVNFVHEVQPGKKQEIESNFNKLWDLDSLGIREKDGVHESVVDNILFTGERYSVGLPWKVGHGPIPLNFANSQARLKSQLRKLRQTPEILQEYNNIIKEQLKANVIEEVAELETASKVSYLPHQAVCREGVETTKVRIVYDASCKDRKSASSLNDCLHKGPALTPLIFDILLRFRANRVAIVGDIEKAFLNIEIHPEDRDCLRFLWVSNVNDSEPNIVTYRFNRVVFGVSSSPFLLNAVLRFHLQLYQESDPDFVRDLTEGFFVDDLVMSCKDAPDAFKLYQKASQRMKEGGFRLRKWKTNNKNLCDQIITNERHAGLEAQGNSQDGCSYAKETLGVSSNMGGKTKVLGIPWDSDKDTLEFNIGKTAQTPSEIVTKRGILSTLATLFDPLGLISPIAVTAKILFQELCVEKLDWDSPLAEEKMKRWNTWLADLKVTDNISVPRCMLADVEGDILNMTLHGFGDASKYAYCAMIFLVCETTKGIYVKLLCTKTRVAPLKSLSIPRLELMSARILVTLMDTVKNALSSQVKIDSVKFWLDSKTALFWIYNQGEWKNFVQHRVNEILRLTRKEDWGHVAGKENPADIGSRGASASELKQSELWWEGPKWLKEGKKAWPKEFNPNESNETREEKRKACVMTTIVEEQGRASNIIDVERFNSLGKLLRVTAYVRRFLVNTRSSKERREHNDTKELTAEELREAESVWVKDAQMTLRDDAKYKKVEESLNIVEQNNVLVCKGRLENSDLDNDSKFPIILPKTHRFTDLVILQCHEQVHHCKVRGTLAELRSRYWIAQGRQYVKKVIKKCITCRRFEGKPFKTPAVAPLPDFRVTEAPPFSRVGVDFAGPVYIKKQGNMEKGWIALFTCCTTRAVHLELVEDLCAATFVNCLRRFSSRRGTPSLIVSDNAKTFKATSKVLKELYESSRLQNYLSSKQIRWKFNLERAAWFGGFFERMIGTMKRCLRKVLGNAKLTADEFTTVLCEVECTLNSRPLTYQYDEIETVLTPFHLIFGRKLPLMSESIEFTEDANKDNQEKLRNRFVYLTNKLSHFWNRWKHEYLVDLREFHRQKKTTPEKISVGDVVLIQEDNIKRGHWKMGIIEKLIIGKDGVVRGAAVRKSGGKNVILNRSILKLFPLEISSQQVERAGDASNEESKDVGSATLTRTRSTRAAAQDSRWKSRIMLDS